MKLFTNALRKHTTTRSAGLTHYRSLLTVTSQLLPKTAAAVIPRHLTQKLMSTTTSTQLEKKVEDTESALRDHIPRGKNRVPYSTWLKVGDVVHGFKLLSVERIEFFDINAYRLEHEATGARYLHLDCSDMDNVFAVLFRTPPDDHTGKPHILEHLATCGTAKYPVRDPFFNMIKRSLNTYMNAWTGSDFTMYPFST